jgi:cell division septum initiation protein DivIVA
VLVRGCPERPPAHAWPLRNPIIMPVGYGMGTSLRHGLVFSAKFVMDVGVTTNPVRPGSVPGGFRQPGTVGSGGSPVPAQRVSDTPDQFDVSLRGYDRHQVDERFAELGEQLAAVAEQNRSLAAQLAEEQRRRGAAERALRELQVGQAAPGGQAVDDNSGVQGFGYRAERLLRMAEAEAHDVRQAAAKEAAELMERARADAEAHRHEIEQNLIMRATALDQKANEVSASLREREQAVAAELTSARSEAESVRAAARQEMQKARRNVEIVARDLRAQAERWAEEHRANADREVERLLALRESLHGELEALSKNLLVGLQAADAQTTADAEDVGDSATEKTSPVPSRARRDT